MGLHLIAVYIAPSDYSDVHNSRDSFQPIMTGAVKFVASKDLQANSPK